MAIDILLYLNLSVKVSWLGAGICCL